MRVLSIKAEWRLGNRLGRLCEANLRDCETKTDDDVSRLDSDEELVLLRWVALQELMKVVQSNPMFDGQGSNEAAREWFEGEELGKVHGRLKYCAFVKVDHDEARIRELDEFSRCLANHLFTANDRYYVILTRDLQDCLRSDFFPHFPLLIFTLTLLRPFRVDYPHPLPWSLDLCAFYPLLLLSFFVDFKYYYTTEDTIS